MLVAEWFSNIIKLEERANQVNPRYKFNTRLDREKIDLFEKAYGISLSESYIQFLERFNGGMILEYDDSFYIDMTEWEPDGPKWSSFYFYDFEEVMDKYSGLSLVNWLLNVDFDGTYPIIPICKTPGPDQDVIFMVSNKGLSNESPVFLSVSESGKYTCTKIARDFNTFLGYYIESDGFPALLADNIEPSLQVFMNKNQIQKIARQKESFSESIARSTSYLQLFPEDKWTFCERGNFYMLDGQLELALADFNKAIKLDEHEGFFYHCRGDLILDHGNPRKALIDLDIAVNIEPDNKMFLKRRADAFLKLNMLKKALEDCTMALAYDNKFTLALYTRIRVYNALGEDEKANADTDFLESLVK